MGSMDGRVALVTGAGRAIGREHALLLAAEGAAVVVNDVHGSQAVADEIVAAGGAAVAEDADIADWAAAHELIDLAVRTFGRLDALVNNAGLGGGDLLGMQDEGLFDELVRVNLKGVWCPTEAAVRHWHRERDAGRPVRASVINTSSGAGLLGNAGQTVYGAAKAGVAAMTVVGALELESSGIRMNAIAPAARTPMAGEGTDSVVARTMRPPSEPSTFDEWHPGNISPLIAYLATADCPVTGQVFHVRGGVVGLFQGWTIPESEQVEGRRWTVPELATRVPELVARGADRSAAGGEAYAALRAALRADRLSAPAHPSNG